MQEQKISEMQKEIKEQEDKWKERIPIIETYNNYIERVESKLNLTMNIFIIVLTIIGIGATALGIYINKRTTKSERELKEMEKDAKDELRNMKQDVINELKKIKDEATRDKDDISEIKKQAEKELSDLRESIKNGMQSDKTPDKQTLELQNEVKTYVKKTTKSITEYTADDWFLLGYDAHVQKKYEDACFYYKKAIESKSDYAEAYYTWGNALLGLARLKSDTALYEESIIKYKKAIEMKPDYAEAYNHWGNALLGLARLKRDSTLFEKSITKYKKAIEIKPDHAKAYNHWGNSLMQLAKLENNLDSRKQEIETLLLKANEIKKGAGSYNLACLHALTGEKEKAFQYLEEDLKYNKGKRARNFIENDADFATLKGNPRFRDLFDKYFPKETT
ncbi:hypothetical protein EZS27_036043 [termite gut metagenome]|uniref:Uncharacterized protein n=1 Tax=termite gut metagenome TaxID=433724 RepID=A0A5J4PU27_9ZZZZ